MPRATLKQRKDGRYCAKYQGRQFLGNTQSEAYSKRDAWKKRVDAGLRAEAQGITVAAYAARWIGIHKRDVILKTRNETIREINVMLAVIGDMRMADVVPSDIQRVYNRRQGNAASYIGHLVQTVNAVFSTAVADRLITHNPCASAAPPKGRSGTHRSIEAWERELILNSQHRFKPAVMAMLYAGLRRGEVLALNVDRDVDYHAMTLTVRKAVRFEGNTPVLTDPKSEAGLRTIPMLDILADVLKPIHGLVSRSAHGTLMTETAFRSAWNSFLVDLSIQYNGDTKRWYGSRAGQGPQWLKENPWHPVYMQTHDFRHSFCTMLYDFDVDFKTAQRWMGHKDQAMMMKIYAHLTSEKEARAEYKLRSAINAKLAYGMQNGMQSSAEPPQSVTA